MRGQGGSVGGVPAEPHDLLGQIGRDLRRVLRFHLPALGLQLAHRLGDVQGVLEDQAFSELRVAMIGADARPTCPVTHR